MAEVVGAFLWRELLEDLSDAIPQGAYGSFSGFSQEGLELGEDQLDRVQIWRVGRQEEKLGAGSFDELPDCLALVGRQVVHHHDVSFGEGRTQDLADIDEEGVAVHRPVAAQRAR